MRRPPATTCRIHRRAAPRPVLISPPGVDASAPRREVHNAELVDMGCAPHPSPEHSEEYKVGVRRAPGTNEKAELTIAVTVRDMQASA
jgi:hypothetical protein